MLTLCPAHKNPRPTIRRQAASARASRSPASCLGWLVGAFAGSRADQARTIALRGGGALRSAYQRPDIVVLASPVERDDVVYLKRSSHELVLPMGATRPQLGASSDLVMYPWPDHARHLSAYDSHRGERLGCVLSGGNADQATVPLQRSMAPIPAMILSRNLPIRFTRVSDCLAELRWIT